MTIMEVIRYLSDLATPYDIERVLIDRRVMSREGQIIRDLLLKFNLDVPTARVHGFTVLYEMNGNTRIIPISRSLRLFVATFDRGIFRRLRVDSEK